MCWVFNVSLSPFVAQLYAGFCLFSDALQFHFRFFAHLFNEQTQMVIAPLRRRRGRRRRCLL